MNGVAADAIRAHVARITSSELFAGTQRLCRFLRFTVEAKLSGRDGEVKEYVIGREVFDRGDGYDPRIDPIVRVEARRLRSRLAEYYGGPGRDDALRLEYPKGGYLPVVHPVQSYTDVKRRPARGAWIAGAISLALAAAIAGVYIARHNFQSPVLAPIPTTWIEPMRGDLDTLDVALAEDVDAELANQRLARVIAWPEVLRDRSMRLLALRDFAAVLGADRLVLILVRDQAGGKLVRVFVVDEPSGQKTLALTYLNPALATAEAQNALAARIAHELVRSPPVAPALR